MLDHYDRVKQAPGVAHSNLYALDLAAYQAQLGQDDQVWMSPHSLLVKRHEPAFDRIEFLTKDIADLQSLLIRHRRRAEIMEWIGSSHQKTELIQLWRPCMAYHRCLMRMSLRVAGAPVTAPPPTLASPSDLPVLREFFDIAFDPWAERVPGVHELEDLVATHNILVSRSDNGALRGFMIRTRTGRTLHLRYLFVDPNFRGQRVGEDLFAQFRADAKTGDRLILWVFPDNPVAISLYQKHGFASDGTVNYIFKSN